LDTLEASAKNFLLSHQGKPFVACLNYVTRALALPYPSPRPHTLTIPLPGPAAPPVLADPAHFEQLFKAHYAPLHRYAYRMVDDEDAAEEIVQSTFVKLWEGRQTLRIEESGQAYLYRAVHNRSLNYLEHQKVKRAHEAHVMLQGEASSNDSDSTTRLRTLEAKLDAALKRLPEGCRTVFQLSRFEDLKYREIADRLGLSVKTVEAQMSKALRILRTELAEFLPILIALFLHLTNRYL
jgi:RNA polymerase sigma-70 factor (ECF subfamily)